MRGPRNCAIHQCPCPTTTIGCLQPLAAHKGTPGPCPQPAEADISGPQGKSEDQPPAKQIAPAEGVTPPAEVHACPTVHSGPCTTRYRCLPTGVTGSRSRPTPPGFGQIGLCRPDAWVRVSFAHTRVSIVGWIYDPDHSLPPGMYVDVPHLDCLLIAAL